MKCPFCGYDGDKVIETRQIEDGTAIRRRRECTNCMKRFTTYEYIETIQIMVVKKDGSRQVFDRSKVMKGILRACEKRNVSSSDVERLTNSVEKEILNLNRKEVSSQEIAEVIMKKLREFDQVAYVRFASVYKQFKDIDSFMEELNKLKFNKE